VEYYNARVSAYGGVVADGDSWRWEPMVHPDDLEETSRAWAAAVAGRRQYEHEHRLRMADGTWRWHLSRGIPLQEEPDGPVHWYGTATDVHDQRRAQEELRRTQESLGLAMLGGRMGWWSRDVGTSEVTWSPELEAIVGLPPGGFRAAGGDEDAFFALVHPDDRAAVMRAVGDAIATGGDYVIEFRYRHAGGAWRWMEGRGRTVLEGGRPAFLFGIGIDIDERKQADGLRDLFVGMLSHELRTPVTAIYGGAQLLRREHLPEEARRDITADLVTESERLERLVENLLVLARVERNAELGGHEPVMLRPILQLVADSEGRRHPGARVELVVEPGLPPAAGEEASVELVVRNVVSNALKYGPTGEPVRVRAVRGDDEILVTVEDRGPGIAPEDRQRVFELFYRSERARRAAPGAGIGLYVVRALVEGMGGRVWAEPGDPVGTRLGFALRRYVEPATPPSG
jgi:PAS domain S-box-containing protein